MYAKAELPDLHCIPRSVSFYMDCKPEKRQCEPIHQTDLPPPSSPGDAVMQANCIVVSSSTTPFMYLRSKLCTIPGSELTTTAHGVLPGNLAIQEWDVYCHGKRNGKFYRDVRKCRNNTSLSKHSEHDLNIQTPAPAGVPGHPEVEGAAAGRPGGGGPGLRAPERGTPRVGHLQRRRRRCRRQ